MQNLLGGLLLAPSQESMQLSFHSTGMGPPENVAHFGFIHGLWPLLGCYQFHCGSPPTSLVALIFLMGVLSPFLNMFSRRCHQPDQWAQLCPVVHPLKEAGTKCKSVQSVTDYWVTGVRGGWIRIKCSKKRGKVE